MIEPMPSHAEVGRQIERVRAAMESGMRNDPRFRALVDSCVAMARQEYGRVDPDHADRAAYEHAAFAAAMLLARVYDEDGELVAMKRERDRYREMALQTHLTMPVRLVMAAAGEDGG